jgi:hypothetical protein
VGENHDPQTTSLFWLVVYKVLGECELALKFWERKAFRTRAEKFLPLCLRFKDFIVKCLCMGPIRKK